MVRVATAVYVMMVTASVMVTTCVNLKRLVLTWVSHSLVVLGSNPLKDSLLNVRIWDVLGLLQRLFQVLTLDLLWCCIGLN